jgi:hypothetical protein
MFMSCVLKCWARAQSSLTKSPNSPAQLNRASASARLSWALKNGCLFPWPITLFLLPSDRRKSVFACLLSPLVARRCHRDLPPAIAARSPCRLPRPAQMEVVNTPNQQLALTNLSFVSAADIRRFPGSIALVGDALVLTLRYPCLSSEPILCLFGCFLRASDLRRALYLPD